MPKLYPPLIENVVPAFVGKQLLVPYELNRAVSWEEVKGLSLIVKTVQNNVVKENGLISEKKVYDVDHNTYIGVFDLSFTPQIGQYYKIQIAFKDITGTIGYYSTVAVTKCTAMPQIAIEGLNLPKKEENKTTVNFSQYIYVGNYSQANGDITEKVYSYQFDIKDSSGNLFDTSGERLHNSSSDISNAESSDTWASSKLLPIDTTYNIIYKVKTLNGLEVSTGSYPIVRSTVTPEGINTELRATLYEEDAYINIHLVPLKTGKNYLSGDFVLTRASSEDNFENWYEVYRFHLNSQYPDIHIWDDYTVSQGFEYKYAIQSYNNKNVYSDLIFAKNYLCEMDEIMHRPVDKLFVEFEDSYLYDGNKQLKICYNPKVSSFKPIILETKVNTLGGKYPFIFRNGNVKYKEFPISGLISKLSDTNGKFEPKQKKEESVRVNTTSNDKNTKVDTLTSLSRENFCEERIFKLKTLEWLSNGEPKLFRSPSEGNYIVRLTNISLTPIDSLGRMLHTFNCTASEIAEYNFYNLEKYQLAVVPKDIPQVASYNLEDQNVPTMFSLEPGKNNNTREMKIGMQNLTAVLANKKYSFGKWDGAYYLSFDNQMSELTLKINFLKNDISSSNFNIANGSGRYTIPAEALKDNPALSIEIISGMPDKEATMTFGYYEVLPKEVAYTKISDMTLHREVRQLVGEEGSEKINIIDNLKDIRTEPGRFHLIKIYPKKSYSIFKFNDRYYKDENHNELIDFWDNTALYYVFDDKQYYCGNPVLNKKLSNKPNYLFRMNSDLYSNLMAGIDGNPGTSGRFESIRDIDKVENLSFGSGLICEIVYTSKTFLYTVETELYNEIYPNIIKKKNIWIKARNEYSQALEDEILLESELNLLRSKMDNAYNSYLAELQSAIKQEDEKGETAYAL